LSSITSREEKFLITGIFEKLIPTGTSDKDIQINFEYNQQAKTNGWKIFKMKCPITDIVIALIIHLLDTGICTKEVCSLNIENPNLDEGEG